MPLHPDKEKMILMLEDFVKWYNEKEVQYAVNTKTGAKMIVHLNGNIQVFKNEKLVWQGIQPFSAIEAYNEI